MILGNNQPGSLCRPALVITAAVCVSLAFGLVVFADQPQPQDTGGGQQQMNNGQSGNGMQPNQPTGPKIISVTVEDPNGQPINAASVIVHTSNYTKIAYGGSTTSGVADVYDNNNLLASGDTLQLDIYPPQQNPAGLVSPDSVTLGVYAGSTLPAQTIKFGFATKTVSGRLTTTTGQPVAHAQIDFSKESGANHAQATSDAAGNYTVKLSGGHWFVHAEDAGSYVAFSQSSDVTFATDTTVENQTLNFDNYVQTDAVITGTIATPDGSSLPQNMSVSIHSQELSSNAMVATTGIDTGSFSVKVPGNKTYTIQLYLPGGPGTATNLGAPSVPPVTVQSGQTKNVGTLTLAKKTAQIKVHVKNGLPGQNVSAFQVQGGGDFTSGQLVASAGGNGGDVVLQVLPGVEYGVTMDAGDMGGGQGNSTGSGAKQIALGGPQFVTAPASVSFEAATTDATVAGRIINASTGTVLASANGFVEANSDVGFIGGSVTNGIFSLSLPSGHTYTLNPVVPTSGFIPKETVKVTPTASSIAVADIDMVPTDAHIQVQYVDPTGKSVGGVFAHASAISNNGNEVTGDFAGSDSSATDIPVVASQGPYVLSAYVDPTAGYSVVRPDAPITLTAGQTKLVKVTLEPQDSLIEGKVTDPTGNPVSGAFVKVDNGDQLAGSDQSGMAQFFELSTSTGSDGTYQLKVASNQTGNIRVYLPPSTLNQSGWINPKSISVSVGSKETKTGVDLQFRKADATVSGSVTYQGQPLSQALVMGYGDDGAANQVFTDATGHYAMSLTNGTTWHVAVRKDADNATDSYQSPMASVDTSKLTSGATVQQNFTANLAANSLPPGASASVTTSSASSVSLANGMNVQIPSNALDTSGNSANVVVKPTSQIVSQSGAVVFGNAYSVTASVNGTDVTSPNSNLTLTFPYDTSKLPKGIQPSDLMVVSFDEATGALRHETGLAIDTVNQTVTVSVSHLTTFALAVSQNLAPADTTPPAAPSAVSASQVSTNGQLGAQLTWTNPTDADFNHVIIYRSTTAGQIGSKIATTSDATTTSYTDSGLTNGTAYYYTLHSVDTTGNESTNTDQIKFTPATSASPTPTPTPAATVLPKTGRPVGPAAGWILGLAIVFGLAGISRLGYARH